MTDYREIVSRIARKSFEEGLVAGTSGNVSVFDREKNKIYITPTNLSYRDMTAEDIVVLDLNGEVLEGKYRPSSEWRLHTGIYKEKEEVNSVIHTHSPYATGFAVVHKKIPLILVEMLPFLGGDIPVAKFGLPGTDEVGIYAAEALNNRNSALLENHGVVSVGRTAEQAYLRAVYTEDAAKIYHFSCLMGTPVCISKEAETILRQKYNLKND